MNTFRQLRNDLRDIEAIADGYKTKIGHDLWLSDGLQKDAVQNSWDARVDKKHGTDWECGFSILSFAGSDSLCISDSGTTGLNGTKFTTEEELASILIRNEKGEDLAYFLNSNWSAKSADEGGRRGRGKTLFLAASKDKRIFFESLRNKDNSYVFGELYIDTDKQVKFKPFYDQEAKDKFFETSDDKFKPLAKYGTRIFIINPVNSVKNTVLNGKIIQFISESRWETIKKYQAKIFVDTEEGRKFATLPYWYEDSPKDIQGRTYPLEIIKEDTHYRVKQLVLRYTQNLDIPEPIEGIAIQRNGMTIQRIQSSELVHEEGIDDIYGWVEMETEPLGQEMGSICEGPEHFDFSWTVKPAKYLRDYIRLRIRDFAKEFKITGEQIKKNKAQRIAEEDAIKSLAPLFKKLGLTGKNIGRKPRKKSKRRADELLRLSAQEIEFPRDNRRVNYGEKIKGTFVIPINEFRNIFRVLIKVYIVSDNGEAKVVEEKEMWLSNGKGSKVGQEDVTITDGDFKKGGYSFRAKMISLEDTSHKLPDGTNIEKGTILYDRINIKFFVESEPLESGKSPIKFFPRSREDKLYLFEWESDGDNGYMVYYNDIHPRIKPLIDSSDEYSDQLTSYLIEQGAIIAFQIKLEESLGDNESDDPDFSRLIKSNSLDAVWPLFQRKFSEFIWDTNS